MSGVQFRNYVYQAFVYLGRHQDKPLHVIWQEVMEPTFPSFFFFLVCFVVDILEAGVCGLRGRSGLM